MARLLHLAALALALLSFTCAQAPTTVSRSPPASSVAPTASISGGRGNITVVGNSTSLLPSSTSSSILPSASANSTINSSNSTSNSTSKSSDELILHTNLDATFGVLGGLLIISGAPMGFWGGRNRWSSYFLTGAYAGSLVVAALILRFGVETQDNSPTSVIRGMFLLACIVGGTVCGGAAILFWKGTRYLVGAGGGFALSLFVLSLHNNVLIKALGLRYAVIAGSAAVGFAIGTFPKWTVYVCCLGTAAMGAAAVVLGIDCFTTGGLKEYWIYILGFSGLFPRLNGYFPLTVTMQAELGVMGALFIMGSAIQWRLLEAIHAKIRELKQQDAERRIVEDAAAYRQTMALDSDLADWEKRYGSGASAPSGKGSSTFSLLPWKTGHGHRDSSAVTGESSGLPPESPSSPSIPGVAYPPGALQKRSTAPSNSSSAAYAPVPPEREGRRSEDLLANRPSLNMDFGDPNLGLVASGSSHTPIDYLPEDDKTDKDVVELRRKMKTLEEVREMRQSIEKLRSELGSQSGSGSGAASTRALGSSVNELDAPRHHSARSLSPVGSSATPPSGAPGSATERAALRPPKPADGPSIRPIPTGNADIDFDKYKQDRSLFRPPGAPVSWTTTPSSPPAAVAPPAPIVAPVSPSKAERRLSQAQSPPAGYQRRQSGVDYFSAQPPSGADPRRQSRYSISGALDTPGANRPGADDKRRSHTLIDLTEPADANGRPLPLEEQERLRQAQARSPAPARVVLGERPTPPPAPKRQSQVMSIEELAARHKSAMREIQKVPNERVAEEAAITRQKAKWEKEQAARAAKVKEDERRVREDKRKSRASLSGFLGGSPSLGDQLDKATAAAAAGFSGSAKEDQHRRQSTGLHLDRLAGQQEMAEKMASQRMNSYNAGQPQQQAYGSGPGSGSGSGPTSPALAGIAALPQPAKKKGPADWLEY